METKICGKCGKELSIDNFYKDKSTKDGLHNYCKDCIKSYRTSKKSDVRGRGGVSTKVYANPDLAKFKPRELIEELRARGYKGTLTYEQVITL